MFEESARTGTVVMPLEGLCFFRATGKYKAYKIMDIRNGMKSLDLKDNELFVVILLFIAIFIAKALLSLPFSSPFIMMDYIS